MANKDKKDIKNNKNKTSFSKGFKAELKKVIWPTPKQLFNNTVAVLAIVIITALIVFVLDFTFEAMNKYGINKIKQVVVNSVEENSTDEDVVELDDENVVLEEEQQTEEQQIEEQQEEQNENTEVTDVQE